MTNQWPEFDELPKSKSVRAVLLEEGSGIAERTKSEIRFLVESEPNTQGGFVHYCILYVPKVDYRYPMMRIIQDHLDYPVEVVADLFPNGKQAGSEPEFRKVLGLVFRSDVVKSLVPQLLELVA